MELYLGEAVPQGSRWSGLSIGRLISDRTARNCVPGGRCRFPRISQGGIDIYEAHGRASKLYKEDEPMAELAPEMRKLCKARLLGLGYGCGPAKFVEVAKSYGVNMTESQAKEQVLLYRAQNPDTLAGQRWKTSSENG